jgi:hypothetical protein
VAPDRQPDAGAGRPIRDQVTRPRHAGDDATLELVNGAI